MKNLIYLFVGALLVISCNTDPCKDKVCGTAGTCTEGICICDPGYEQDSTGACNVAMRTKFIGSWVVTDSCTRSGTASFNVSSTAGTNITDIKFTNFWNLFNNAVNATVSGSNFSIANQEPDSDQYFVETIGNASITGTTISMTYVVTNKNTTPHQIDTCYSSWVKQ